VLRVSCFPFPFSYLPLALFGTFTNADEDVVLPAASVHCTVNV